MTELSAVADVFPSPTRETLRGDLVCYARAVIHEEWPAMKNGNSSAVVESWVDALHSDFAAAAPLEAQQEAAFSQWFDQVAQRRDGRRERLAEAAPVLPMPLWFALGIGALATLTYMVVQADARENKLIQALPIACVSAIVTAGLLVVVFLDNPYTGGDGSIKPAEMSRTLDRIQHGVAAPCDERGNPT